LHAQPLFRIIVNATIISDYIWLARKMARNVSFGRLISIIHRNISIYIDSEFKEQRIGTGQVSFLRVLQYEDGINQETLTANFGVNKATTARAIAKLVKEGYVTRKRDKADNRAYKIYLTKKGKKIGLKLNAVVQQLAETLSTGLTEAEKASIIRLLTKMSQNILALNESTRQLIGEKNGKRVDS
jgi:DNA-binding MarR family transcriptional regulator